MKKFINPCTTYIYLWCFYSLQGVLYESGTIISQSILLILLMWSARSCYLVNFKKKQPLPAFIKAVNVFLIVATVYGGLLMLSRQELYVTEVVNVKVSNISYLKEIYLSMLPLYPFYYYSKRKELNESQVVFLLLLFIAITWAQFFYKQSILIAEAIANGSTREEFTNNVGYSFVSLFPLLLFCNKKPLLQYMLLIICMCGIIMSMKRGAIVVGAFCFAYFLYSAFKTNKGYAKLAVTILSIVAIVATCYIVSNMLATSDYFVQRLDKTLEGDSSNRDMIYGNLWNIFLDEQNLLIILIGRGAYSTLTVAMNFAHNDWLELLTNQGLLGVVVYIYYFIALLKDAQRVRKTNKLYSNVLYMSFCILFFQTLFSMSYASIKISQMLAIGLVLGSFNVWGRNNGYVL